MAQGVTPRARRSGTGTALDPPKTNVRINPDGPGLGTVSIHNGQLSTLKVLQPSVQYICQLDAAPNCFLLVFGATQAKSRLSRTSIPTRRLCS